MSHHAYITTCVPAIIYCRTSPNWVRGSAGCWTDRRQPGARGPSTVISLGASSSGNLSTRRTNPRCMFRQDHRALMTDMSMSVVQREVMSPIVVSISPAVRSNLTWNGVFLTLDGASRRGWKVAVECIAPRRCFRDQKEPAARQTKPGP